MGVFASKRLKQAGVTFTTTFNPTLYKNYTKFVVIRHPFDRILSTFYNIKHGSRYGLGPGRPIKNTLIQRNNITNIKGLQFEQFVDFLTNTSYKTMASILFDRHLDTFAHACNLCGVNYDYVIRFEDMANDAGPILKQLGFSEDYLLKREVLNKGRREKSVEQVGDTYLKEFKGMDPRKIDALAKRFSIDMKLLGYSFDPDTSMTSCKVKAPGDGECC